MGGLDHPHHKPNDDSGAGGKGVQSSGKDTKLDFSEDEESLISRMFKLVGERWSLIAGRIPGRTAEEIEKYWTSKHNNSSSER